MSEKVVHIDFAKIRDHAKAERWTPSAIARETGISPAGIGYIFAGRVDPKASSLKKICDTIGLPIEQAFTQATAA